MSKLLIDHHFVTHRSSIRIENSVSRRSRRRQCGGGHQPSRPGCGRRQPSGPASWSNLRRSTLQVFLQPGLHVFPHTQLHISLQQELQVFLQPLGAEGSRCIVARVRAGVVRRDTFSGCGGYAAGTEAPTGGVGCRGALDVDGLVVLGARHPLSLDARSLYDRRRCGGWRGFHDPGGSQWRRLDVRPE